MLVHNGNVVTRNGDWLKHVVHLPPYTIRIRTTNGEPYPFTYHDLHTRDITQVKVPFTDDVYDITCVDDNWFSFLGEDDYHTDEQVLKEVIAFNSTGIKRMDSLFRNQPYLEKTVSFDTSTVVRVDHMYCKCSSLIEAPEYDFTSVTSADGLYERCPSLLKTAPLTLNYISPWSIGISDIYYQSGAPDCKFGPIYLPNEVNITHIYRGTNAKECGDIIAPNLQYMHECFGNSPNLVKAPNITTSNLICGELMFWYCPSLKEVPLYDFSKLEDMHSMFRGCTSLEELPNFNTSKVTDMRFVCEQCSSLKKVPDWNPESVTTLISAFDACRKVESGSYAFYQKASQHSTIHASAFRNCGVDTVTGAAELAMIPSSWKEDE